MSLLRFHVVLPFDNGRKQVSTDEGSGDGAEDSFFGTVVGVTTQAPRQGCRADDVVRCPEDDRVHICEVQLCDGHNDCPLGYDERNCSTGTDVERVEGN